MFLTRLKVLDISIGKMAFKRRFRRKRRKRRTRRRRRGNPRMRLNSIRIRGPSAFPDKVFVRLRYLDSLAIAFSGLNAITFSGNSLFGPDPQAIGNQPRGFQEWMAIYGKYKVHKSSIKCVVLNVDNSVNLDAVVLPHVGTIPAIVDTEDAREQPYAKSKQLGARGSNAAVRTIYNNMKTKVVFGNRWTDDEYGADVNNPPLKQWFWAVFLQHLVSNTGTVNADIAVSITYFCEFYQRKFIPPSVDPA